MMKSLRDEIKRDYEIFREIQKMYDFEWRRTELLNEKAINITTSTGIIMTLFITLGTFSLERVFSNNPFYVGLIAILMLGLTLFLITILFSLYAYKIMSYEGPEPRKFIDEYKNRSLSEFFHFYGGDVANSILTNNEVNNKRTRNMKCALISLFVGILTMGVFVAILLFALQISYI